MWLFIAIHDILFLYLLFAVMLLGKIRVFPAAALWNSKLSFSYTDYHPILERSSLHCYLTRSRLNSRYTCRFSAIFWSYHINRHTWKKLVRYFVVERDVCKEVLNFTGRNLKNCSVMFWRIIKNNSLKTFTSTYLQLVVEFNLARDPTLSFKQAAMKIVVYLSSLWGKSVCVKIENLVVQSLTPTSGIGGNFSIISVKINVIKLFIKLHLVQV